MEFTGWLKVPVTGDYSFQVRSDDCSDLALYLPMAGGSGWDVITSVYQYVDISEVQLNPGTRTLIQDVWYPFRLRYIQAMYGKGLIVEWQTPTSPSTWETVPFDFFKCSSASSSESTLADIRACEYPDPRVNSYPL